MEQNRITLPPISAPGEVTTFYSFECATARSMALSNMGVLLAGRQDATVPVLMIDWDTESPGLHLAFGRQQQHLGLLDYFEACRGQLASLGRCADGVDDAMLARQVLEAIDWERYVERVDESRPLYLMRAGLFDERYGERADGMDWDGLFHACPALFRCFGEHLTRRFRHVLIDARSGRSAAVSICTTLLPRTLVALFTPSQRSLDGLCGVVTRAIDYRCSHEDEQHALLVYPVPTLVDSADRERRQQWRRGDAHRGGYQPVLETLLRDCYARSSLSLDSYFDEIQLQQTNAMSGGEQACLGGADSDRFSLARIVETLLDWLAEGHFPWQSHAEVRLQDAIASARLRAGGAVPLPLARELETLGALYGAQGRLAEARASLEECTALRASLLGPGHLETRSSRSALAAVLRQDGQLDEARTEYQALLRDCLELDGPDHPATRAARAGLAATLALLGQFERALALHEEVNGSCERLLGAGHAATLDSLAGQAHTLWRAGQPGRARMVYERVLEGRQRLLGREHDATLRCAEQLAALLCAIGETAGARALQEQVLDARERHAGPVHGATEQAREVLADILAAQGDLNGVAEVLQGLARSRARRLGAEHPATLGTQLQLATTLGQLDDLDAARRLQQQVVDLHERVLGKDDLGTLESKRLLAATLARMGHSVDAQLLEQGVLSGHERQLRHFGVVAGAHAAQDGVRHALLCDSGDGDGHLGHKLVRLQELIDERNERAARDLADSLRKPVLGLAGIGHPLRGRAVAMIRQVYQQGGDIDALLAFTRDEVSWLEGALVGAGGARAG
ncbi:MAG: tetratricopeptide repeat protein [Pseudomonadota bacterium]